jgi:glycosyltransferase involved in cell wall biosynthesis
MSQRLKVLMSAYACEPGKGSEPEVGWQWALQMARYHDVTVLTRTNNRPAIEPALAALRGSQPLPAFIYHDRSPLVLDLKRRTKSVKLYYLLWQRSARDLIAQLHATNRYDLLHHVTFAGFRYPVAIWGHGAPCLWGPIGGIESIPFSLLPWHHLRSLTYELLRNANNLLQAAPFHVLPKRASATTLILVSTREMQQTFGRLGFDAEVMPTIGLSPAEMPFQPHRPSEGPLRLLFVGNIITLKGVDLALEALQQSQTNAVLTLIGTGSYLAAAKRLVGRLGLHERVQFEGRLPREEVLKAYPRYDVFIFPSLHDTGGYAIIEAMFNELPVICLDYGGPAVVVQDGCGIKVPLGPRAEVIAGLAAAIRQYDQNRAAIQEHGRASREVILRDYDWDKKGVQMNERYLETVARSTVEATLSSKKSSYSGMGGVTNLAHRVLSLIGLTGTALVLVLVGALGFLSVGHLKQEADLIVRDTLPGLSSAGEAISGASSAFNRTLMFLVTENAEQRAQFRKDVETRNQATSRFLEAYQLVAFSPGERTMFEQVMKRRTDYLQLRERVFEMADRNERTQAIDVCNRELFPAYAQYRESLNQLFEFNVRQGKNRGEAIMRVCTITQWVVAGIGVFIFAIGFLVGLFK